MKKIYTDLKQHCNFPTVPSKGRMGMNQRYNDNAKYAGVVLFISTKLRHVHDFAVRL